MPRSTEHERYPDAFTEFAEELRQLAETVLERVEPALRNASEGRPEWAGCSWCPVCATAALMRGEHHDVLTAVADHGTAIVTVLREALAGAPVEPVLPTDPHTTGHPDAAESPSAADNSSAAGDPGANVNPGAAGKPRTGAPGTTSADADTDTSSAHEDTAHDHTASGRAGNRSPDRTGGVGDPARAARDSGSARKRSGYTGIPVTIRT